MRTIETHKSNVCNEHIHIEVRDEPGPGGANHRYELTGFDTASNPAAIAGDGFKASFTRISMIFQHGPIKEVGVNGVTAEALLAIVSDRLRGFQGGPYACHENAMALTAVEEALNWMLHRTRQREARGVEGTHAV